MTERDSSPAYRALSPSGRTVLALIERQVEHKGGTAVLSFSDIETLLGVTHGTCGYALRQVSRGCWQAESHTHRSTFSNLSKNPSTFRT